jgi:hypothetical protein
MEFQTVLFIALAVLVMATLYSAVGHGGGSGYLAVLAIASIAPEQMRPTALILNVVVSSIATWKFSASGTFRKELFLPLICASIPASFVGGIIEIPSQIYKPVVGLVLLYAAFRLFIPIQGNEQTKKPVLFLVLLAGATIGIFSGVIGVGGGIFLSPLILLLGWTTARQTAAITAPFILVNSVAALGGIATDSSTIPVEFGFIVPLTIAVVVGGFIGSSFGSKKLGHQGLRATLGVVLFIAASKMFITFNSSPNELSADAIKYQE